jgi:hypothetical protein
VTKGRILIVVDDEGPLDKLKKWKVEPASKE